MRARLCSLFILYPIGLIRQIKKGDLVSLGIKLIDGLVWPGRVAAADECRLSWKFFFV